MKSRLPASAFADSIVAPLLAAPWTCRDACASATIKTAAPHIHTLFISANSSPGLRNHIDDRRFPAFDRSNRSPNRGSQVVGIADRTFCVQSHALSHFCEIDRRIVDHRPYFCAVDPALASIRHPLNMHELLVVGAVVMHDVENGNAVMRRRPHNAGSVQQISIVLNVDAQAPMFS